MMQYLAIFADKSQLEFPDQPNLPQKSLRVRSKFLANEVGIKSELVSVKPVKTRVTVRKKASRTP